MKRRNFLTAMGLAGGSLFLPSLLRRGLSAPGDPPKRLFIMFTQHGTHYPGWRMRWPGQGDDATTWKRDIASAALSEFSDGLKPLHPHRRKLAIVDGISLVSGEADSVAALRHEIAQAQVLSGVFAQSVAGLVLSGGASIDQRIADAIARPDRLRSLELTVGGAPPICYRGPRQLLPAEHRPEVVWDRLFGLSSTQGDPTTGAKAQQSVLDMVANRYDALSGRLSASDRQKLSLHRDMVRDMETRITGMVSASCADAPERRVEDTYASDMDTMTRLISTAFACDLVRVATVNLGDIPSEDLGYPDVSIHDEHAHQVHINAEAGTVMTQWTAYHAQQFANVMAALDAVPEGNGTMLDNTVCLWFSELGDGAHGFERVPVVIGGGGFAFKLGQYIHYPSDVPIEGWWWDGTKLPSMARPHQHLLTSIGREFGLKDSSGNVIDGMPLREVYGIGDVKIPLTGVIPELFA